MPQCWGRCERYPFGTSYCHRGSGKDRLWVGEEGTAGGRLPAKPVVSRCLFFFFFLSHQSAADIGQIQELQLQLEEVKKEKHKLQEQVCAQSCHIVGEAGKGSLQDLILWILETVIHSFIHSTSFLCQMRTIPADTHTHPHTHIHPHTPLCCSASKAEIHSVQDFLPLRNGSKETGWSVQDRIVVLCEIFLCRHGFSKHP